MLTHRQSNSIDDSIYVVGCIDDNYVQHLAVTFVSLLENVGSRCVSFFVVGDDLSLANQERLVATVAKYDAVVEFLSGDFTQFDACRMDGHMSRASYLRLLVAELLPGHVHKFIYLDSDVVVEVDITTLWDIDLSDYTLAAVLDHEIANRLEILTGAADSDYFNSGVLLVNLDRWRDDCVSSAISDCLQSRGSELLFADQDVLNLVFRDRWLPLDSGWNYIYSLNSDVEGVPDGHRLPKIIHFAGPHKPWRALRYHPMRQRYFHYLELTEWRGYRPQLTIEDCRDSMKIHAKKTCPSGYAMVKNILVNERLWGKRLSMWFCRMLDIRNPL